MTLSAEKTISLATFRKSGDKIATPVWVVPVSGGRIGFWTSSTSGKAKRLRNNPAVEVTACNQRGVPKPGAPTVGGAAELVTSGAAFDEVTASVKAKYGFMVPVSKFFNGIGARLKGRDQPYGDVVVLITLTG
jgi:PPOX class probable F420-dependent enzyme